MGTDSRNNRFCDECGQTITKATRVYKGSDYCATCYARCFRHVPCSLCGASVRVHTGSAEPPVCRKCSQATRTCSRCGKPVPGKAGRVIEDQVICAACAPYFSRQEPCERCGRLSMWLSRAPSLGIEERVCDSCRNRASHRTCSVCGKYRKVAGRDVDGKALCKACLLSPSLTHPCPSCGMPVPGAGASRCRSCTNYERLVHEARLQSLTLVHPWAQEMLRGFSEWLLVRSTNDPGLSRTFMAHIGVFQRIDAAFAEISELSSASLLREFGSKELRKHLLVTQYLEEHLGISVADRDRRASSDHDLIAVTLLESTKTPWGHLLAGYANAIMARRLATRTQRMYIRTAAKLCEDASLSEQRPLTRHHLGQLLSNLPGSRANVSAFVRYCSDELGWDIAMPVSKASGTFAATRAINRFYAEFDKVNASGAEKAPYQALTNLLAAAFSLKPSMLRHGDWRFTEKDGTTTIQNGTCELSVPQELCSLAKRWCDLQKSAVRAARIATAEQMMRQMTAKDL